MAAHTYWRFSWATSNGGGNIALAEVELRTSVGGADAATGGTAGGTNVNGSFPAANAFDDNSSTDYQSSAVVSTLSYQFGSAVDIVEYAFKAAASLNVNLAPNVWTLEYSDDGAAWTPAARSTGQSSWTASEQRVFPVAIAARKLPISVPAVQTGSAAGTVSRLGTKSASSTRNLAGVAKVGGVATGGLLVRVYDKYSGTKLGEALSAGDGSYSIPVGGFSEVFAVCYNPVTYKMLAFDQVMIPA
jgi:hypothetical protein